MELLIQKQNSWKTGLCSTVKRVNKISKYRYSRYRHLNFGLKIRDWEFMIETE